MIIYLTLLIFVAYSVSGMTPGWREEKMEAIVASQNLPSNERIEFLAQFVRIGIDRAGSAPINDAQREVYEKARQLLLSIPGYADYYANRVKAARAELNAETVSYKRGPLQSKLRKTKVDCFETLSLLPSAESVRVLGEFLYDEEGRVPPSPPGTKDDRNRRQRKAGESPNSFYALRAIANLPIVSKPTRREMNRTVYDEDIELWRIWYEQVKAGNRTFQFEGDPKHYNLEGPVAKAIEPASLARPRKDGPAEDSSPVAAEEPSRFPVGVLAAAVALLGVAVWFAMTRGRDAGVKGRRP